MAFTAQQSASGTLVANTAQAVTFGDNTANVPIRYAYVAVNNTGTTVLYARSDGTAATVAGDFCITVQPGATAVLANEFPWWSQAANVIGKANNPVVSPWTPTETQPYGLSPYGQKASPGTSVSLISTGTPTFTVSGTG